MSKDRALDLGPVGITEKQRATLDLLVKFMTSKEIALELGISRHTVDQRIETLKRKFGASTRSELAQAFLQSLPIPERMTHEFSPLAASPAQLEEPPPEELEPLSMFLNPEWVDRPERTRERKWHQVGPELFSGPSGTTYRIAAIVITTVLLVIALLGGISIYVELSRIFEG